MKEGCIEQSPEAPERLATPLGLEAEKDDMALPVVHVQGRCVSVKVLLPKEEAREER